MRLSEEIVRQLEAVSPRYDSVGHAEAMADGVRLRCDYASAERMGCALLRVEMSDEREFGDAAAMTRRLESFCERARYLLEPLRTIEVDARRPSVLVRSMPPRRDGDRIAFYDMVAGPDHKWVLQRIGHDLTTRVSTPAPFAVTHEQLRLLLDDMVASARGVG